MVETLFIILMVIAFGSLFGILIALLWIDERKKSISVIKKCGGVFVTALALMVFIWYTIRLYI